MPAKTDDLKVKRDHKEEAISFLRLTASGAVKEAFDSYITEKFRHHSPYFPGDVSSLTAAMESEAAAHPDKELQVERAIEEGDLVAVHSRVRMSADDGPEMGMVHIFRFEGDRIAEMWDLGQPVPEESPNQYGMF